MTKGEGGAFRQRWLADGGTADPSASLGMTKGEGGAFRRRWLVDGGTAGGHGGAWGQLRGPVRRSRWLQLDAGGSAFDQAVESQQDDGSDQGHDEAGALPLLI